MHKCFLLLLVVITVAASGTCFVGAEKERLRGCHNDETSGGSPARYLKSRGAVTEGEERGGISLTKLKALLGLKSSKIQPNVLAATFSNTETKNLQKVASEISKTKVTPDEAKKLQKAVTYVTERKLTQADVKVIRKTVSEIANNPSRWRRTLSELKNYRMVLVILLATGWVPVVAYVKRDEIYGSQEAW